MQNECKCVNSTFQTSVQVYNQPNVHEISLDRFVHRSRVQTFDLVHGLAPDVKLGDLKKQIQLTEVNADGEAQEVSNTL